MRMRYIPPVLALVLLCFVGDLRAGISAAIPFARLSEDETRILVVRHETFRSGETQATNPTLSNGEKIDFLADYPRSGVYQRSNRNLIYKIDWWCLDDELLASPDLNHLARVNPFGKDWAITFTTAGSETATYTMDDLLVSFKSERFRPYTSWDWHYEWYDSFKHHAGKLIVETARREFSGFPIGYYESHTFDFETGRLESTRIHNGGVVVLLSSIAVTSILILVVTVFTIRFKRNQPMRTEKELG